MRSVTYYKEEIVEGGGKEWVKINLDKGLAEAAYKDYVNRNIRNFDIRVKFNNEELTASDIASIKINSDLFSGDTFTIGSTVAETLDLKIFRSYGEISKTTPIIPYISLYTKVEIDHVLTPIKQEVCMGIFYIAPDNVTEDGLKTTTVRASSLFNHSDYGGRTFEVSDPNVPFNRSLTDIVNNICSDINNDTNFSPNIELNTVLPSITITDENSDNIVGKTYGEIINYVAALYGGYARIVYDEDGNGGNGAAYLEFFRLREQSGYFYDKSNYMSFKTSKDFLNIWKIECKARKKSEEEGEGEEETTIIAGSGDKYHTAHMECADMTQERLDEILTYYKNYSYHPMTSKIFGSPVLEIGDRVLIRGRAASDGTQSEGSEMPLHSITYNITGNGLTMDIKSVFKVNNNTSVRKAIKDVSNEVQKAKEDLTKEVEDIKEKQEELEDRMNGLEEAGGSTHNPVFSGTIKIKENSSDTEHMGEIFAQNYDIGDETYEGLVIAGKEHLTLGIRTNNDTAREDFMHLYGKGNDRTVMLDTLGTFHMNANTINMYGGTIDGGIHYTGSMDDGTATSTDLYWKASRAELYNCKLGSTLDANDQTIKNAKFEDCDFSGISGGSGGTLDTTYGKIYKYGYLYNDYPDGPKIYDGLCVSGQNILNLGLHPTIPGPNNVSRTLISLHNYSDTNYNYDSLINFHADVHLAYQTLYGCPRGTRAFTYFNIYRANLEYCRLLTDIAGNGYDIINATHIQETEAQSEYTSRLINSGTNENMIYGGYNYDKGEVRWCWKENVFTYPECDIDPETDEWVYTGRYLSYVELPIFMAENIQNDYHINICKKSWGDYRIIEQNPYYFILESQEDDFAFTFEVVAKLNDNQTLNNNTVIANIGSEYLADLFTDGEENEGVI